MVLNKEFNSIPFNYVMATEFFASFSMLHFT